jgi:hypothetical protein
MDCCIFCKAFLGMEVASRPYLIPGNNIDLCNWSVSSDDRLAFTNAIASLSHLPGVRLFGSCGFRQRRFVCRGACRVVLVIWVLRLENLLTFPMIRSWQALV